MGRTYLLITTLFCGLGVFEASSQIAERKVKAINNQIWLDLIPHYALSDAFELYGDVSFRIREANAWYSLSVRPSIKYQLTPIVSFHSGFGFFYNEITEDDNMIEFRPWQGVRIGFPDFGPIKLKHLIRLEERFSREENSSNTRLLNYRIRYQLGTKIPLNNKYVKSNTVYIPLSFEWLANADDELVTFWHSQSRLTLGAGYTISDKWIIEFEYMRWWSKDGVELSFESTDNIFRLKLLINGWIYGE